MDSCNISPRALARTSAISEFVQGDNHLYINALRAPVVRIGCTFEPLVSTISNG
jgi:hypothetical protein